MLWPFCSLKECLIVVGILLGYLVSYLYIEQVGGWRSMYGLSIIPAVALGAGMVRHNSTFPLHS